MPYTSEPQDPPFDAEPSDDGPSQSDLEKFGDDGDDDTIDCPQCGKTFIGYLEHCPSCGHWLEEDAAAAPKRLAIGLVLAALMGVMLFYWTMRA